MVRSFKAPDWQSRIHLRKRRGGQRRLPHHRQMYLVRKMSFGMSPRLYWKHPRVFNSSGALSALRELYECLSRTRCRKNTVINLSLVSFRKKEKVRLIEECPSGTLFSFIRLKASYIATQFYYATHSFIAFGSLRANKISLKPIGFNITIAVSNHITLCAAKNITIQKLLPEKEFCFFSSSGSFVLYRYKQGICAPNSYSVLDSCP